MPALLLVLRLGLGALFVIAGMQKLRDPAAFANDITNYQLFPSYAALLAATLPTTEVVAGLGLLVPSSPWRRAAAAAIALMMLVFTIAAASALSRGIDISCGCFGAGAGDTIDALTIVRDLALLGAAVLLVVADRRPVSPPGSSSVR
jgi:uncharacterized membrane protein YphA (DoxX/SURF4 family)